MGSRCSLLTLPPNCPHPFSLSLSSPSLLPQPPCSKWGLAYASMLACALYAFEHYTSIKLNCRIALSKCTHLYQCSLHRDLSDMSRHAIQAQRCVPRDRRDGSPHVQFACEGRGHVALRGADGPPEMARQHITAPSSWKHQSEGHQIFFNSKIQHPTAGKKP
jgi:hypothetical protein